MRISDWSSDVCSSDLESDAPNRIRFDLRRLMRTKYRIDTFQKSYFVIRSFDELFDATRPDFAPLYAGLAALPDFAAAGIAPADAVLTRGTLDAKAGGWGAGTADVGASPSAAAGNRSEERRVGKEGVSTCRARGGPR